jgi:hypothetical protein
LGLAQRSSERLSGTNRRGESRFGGSPHLSTTPWLSKTFKSTMPKDARDTSIRFPLCLTLLGNFASASC